MKACCFRLQPYSTEYMYPTPVLQALIDRCCQSGWPIIGQPWIKLGEWSHLSWPSCTPAVLLRQLSPCILYLPSSSHDWQGMLPGQAKPITCWCAGVKLKSLGDQLPWFTGLMLDSRELFQYQMPSCESKYCGCSGSIESVTPAEISTCQSLQPTTAQNSQKMVTLH